MAPFAKHRKKHLLGNRINSSLRTSNVENLLHKEEILQIQDSLIGILLEVDKHNDMFRGHRGHKQAPGYSPCHKYHLCMREAMKYLVLGESH